MVESEGNKSSNISNPSLFLCQLFNAFFTLSYNHKLNKDIGMGFGSSFFIIYHPYIIPDYRLPMIQNITLH